MLALGMHAVFEGIVIGIAEEKAELLNYVLAVSLHKGAEAIALVNFCFIFFRV